VWKINSKEAVSTHVSGIYTSNACYVLDGEEEEEEERNYCKKTFYALKIPL
jgi:hypothetical protein